RPDTLFGATYMVIAPDHRLTLEICSAEQRQQVKTYAEAAARKSDLERTALGKDKTGVFTGAYAINPVNGKRIPIYTADYVLGSYGTGAIMAVPAHDQRDFEFAKAFDLPIVQVVSHPDDPAELSAATPEYGTAINSGQFDGQPTEAVKKNIVAWLEERGLGTAKVNFKLRDWVFSRQRYWGEPIPVYFPVETNGDPRKGDPFEIDYSTPIAVEESELPLRLPDLEDYHPGDPQGPLVKALEWRFFQKDGKWFARETNTMPQWAGSCWYYLRYLDPHNDEKIFSEQAYDDWMPVDLYVGGAEHAVLHLLYARFWHKVLYDCGVVKHAEPFQKLVHQGMILGQAFRWYAVVDGEGKLEQALAGTDSRVEKDAESGELSFEGHHVEERWVPPTEVKSQAGKPMHPEHGVELALVTEKMAKSRGNVVNPDIVVEEHGADSLRAYEMFMGPLEQVKPWQTSGIQGVRRWLDRVHALSERAVVDTEMQLETAKLVHRTVKKVGEDIDALRLNTAVSAMMILTNHLNGLTELPREALERLVLILGPFAPHLSEELWEKLGHQPSVADVSWPEFDPALCEDDEVEIAVQVLGKVRGRVMLSKDASEADAEAAALADEHVQRSIAGKPVKKLIYRPGKIINFII
ncbi:MAG: leucine--tRNA ligase, partial [Myxococcales bacterium]|nr:leucine--tRNA ligase [Myxococcales bacterium]